MTLRCPFCGNTKPDQLEVTKAGNLLCFCCALVSGPIATICPRCGWTGSHAESCPTQQELWGY